MPVHRQAVRKMCWFNCCPQTTTLLRLSGGVVWFSHRQFLILQATNLIQMKACDLKRPT